MKSLGKYYVSITGLQVKSIWHYPQFAFHAISSFNQAQSAAGNVFTDARVVDGIHHTITVWESKSKMIEYLRSGAHLQAMKNTKKVGKYGKVYSFESDSIPSWPEALQLWREHGRLVLGKESPDESAAEKIVGDNVSYEEPPHPVQQRL